MEVTAVPVEAVAPGLSLVAVILLQIIMVLPVLTPVILSVSGSRIF